MKKDTRIAFIIGSPRSGTTILGDILSTHVRVAHIYEPYFIWCYHVADISTDYIPPADIGPEESEWIRSQFAHAGASDMAQIVLDKLPMHSFNLPIVHRVFPNAQFIHILRDGRDVVLSIKKEWAKRQSIVKNRRYVELVRTAYRMLKRNSSWRLRRLAIQYELKTNLSWNPSRYLNKAKWRGQIGWGPRFRDWHKVLASEPLICFHAHQWLHCIDQIGRDLPAIPKENVLEIRYEDLVAESHDSQIRRVVDFLELEYTAEFAEGIPNIAVGNVGKWKDELSPEEIDQMGPLLSDKLIDLGYERDRQWYSAREATHVPT